MWAFFFSEPERENPCVDDPHLDNPRVANPHRENPAQRNTHGIKYQSINLDGWGRECLSLLWTDGTDLV